MILLVPEPSINFSILHDSMTCVTVTCDITPLLLSKSKIKKEKRELQIK